jgi:hypothetical protein
VDPNDYTDFVRQEVAKVAPELSARILEVRRGDGDGERDTITVRMEVKPSVPESETVCRPLRRRYPDFKIEWLDPPRQAAAS